MPDHSPSRVAVMRADLQFSVRALTKIATGEVVLSVHGETRDRPTGHSVQIGVGRHIDVPDGVSVQQELDEYPWRFLNHSCHPNAALRGLDIVATRDIEPWSEVTFDYNTTEYQMSRPFRCACNHADCAGVEVAGFRALDDAERERLRPLLSDHLLTWWDAQRSA